MNPPLVDLKLLCVFLLLVTDIEQQARLKAVFKLSKGKINLVSATLTLIATCHFLSFLLNTLCTTFVNIHVTKEVGTESMYFHIIKISRAKTYLLCMQYY